MNRVTFRRQSRVNRRQAASVRPQVEVLEARNLLSVPANVLVNNPNEDGASRDFTQSETNSVVFGNTIVVGYNDTDTLGASVQLDTHTQGVSISTNGGQTFTDKGTLPTGSNGPFSDPVLARDQSSGTIYWASVAAGNFLGVGPAGGPSPPFVPAIDVNRSFDGGATFQTAVNAAPGFGTNNYLDKPWIAVDNFPGPGQGNVYVAFNNFLFTSAGANDQGIYFTRSTDGGNSWGPSGGMPIRTPKGNQAGVNAGGAYVTVGPDHAVYVFWWDFSDGATIRMSKSTDFGATFSTPSIVAGLKTHGSIGDLGLTDGSGNSFETNAYPQAAVNPVTGDIYVAYDDEASGSTDKADIFFTMSTDGGNSWSKPGRVNDDTTTNDQWFPALAMTPDGKHVGIFWYDRRLDPANNLIDRFGVIGDVSGHTVNFRANFRITDVSFPPEFNIDHPVVRGNYMADYDSASADNNNFYTTWGDNRLPDANNPAIANQPDVRFAKIPVSGLDPASAPLAPRSFVGAPAGSTGTAAVPLPSAGLANPARGGDLLPGGFMTLAAGLALPLPGQAMTIMPAASTPATPTLPPLVSPSIDLFLTEPGKEDRVGVIAAALHCAPADTGDRWDDVLGQLPWGGATGDGVFLVANTVAHGHSVASPDANGHNGRVDGSGEGHGGLTGP
jgi:hypothetical protein